MSSLSKRPMVIVDLGAGRWVLTKTGHECYNLTPNEHDGRFYGYCPPHGSLNIERLGAKPTDDYIDGVVIVYTKKIIDSADREIIAFIENARVYRTAKKDPKLGRKVMQDGKIKDCAYCIVSDNLYDLRDYTTKYVIRTSNFNPYMFRMQRSYKGKHPSLDKEIFDYLENYLNSLSDEDSLAFHKQVIEESVQPNECPSNNSKNEPQYVLSGGSKAVSKNAHVSKLALLHSGFKCIADDSHKTFVTTKGIQYMEGHHLIPCTYANAVKFWTERGINIDCEENIVPLCPTCHRKVHFGSNEEREAILRVLFSHQINRLKSVGLGLSFEELKALYNLPNDSVKG